MVELGVRGGARENERASWKGGPGDCGGAKTAKLSGAFLRSRAAPSVGSCSRRGQADQAGLHAHRAGAGLKAVGVEAQGCCLRGAPALVARIPQRRGWSVRRSFYRSPVWPLAPGSYRT